MLELFPAPAIGQVAYDELRKCVEIGASHAVYQWDDWKPVGPGATCPRLSVMFEPATLGFRSGRR